MGQSYQQLIENSKKIIIAIFFLVLLLTGFKIYKDYGVSGDEYYQQHLGRIWTDYSDAVLHTRSLAVPLPKYSNDDLIHGPAFEIFLTVLGDCLKLYDSRDIMLMRHLNVFLLFYIGVIFFYFLCRRIFQSWRLALLGSVFLVLSPRIFADAFYNSLDISFFGFFIIGTFTLLWMLDSKTVRSAGIHALICAILISIRPPMGVFLSALTVPFFLFEIIRIRSPRDRQSGVITFVCYISFFLLLAIVFNPFLWSAPWMHINDIVKRATGFRYWNMEMRQYYFGPRFSLRELPWHYVPVWIMVSTPMLYGVLFFVGIFVAIKLFLRNTTGLYLIKRNIIIFLICFFLPLIIGTRMHYNGWRHIYFIYPSLLIFVILGVQYLWQNTRSVVRGVFAISIVLSLMDTAIFMIRNHPYQNLYFNRLAGVNASEITKRFELDYWGVSYRKALEYILKTDKDTIIPVCFFPRDTAPAYNNLKIIFPEERKRLVLVDSVEKAKYCLYLTNMMIPPFSYIGEEYYSIKVDGMNVMVIYKLDH